MLNLWIFRYAQNDKCLRFFAAIVPCNPLSRFVLTHSAQNDKMVWIFRLFEKAQNDKMSSSLRPLKSKLVNLLSKP